MNRLASFRAANWIVPAWLLAGCSGGSPTPSVPPAPPTMPPQAVANADSRPVKAEANVAAATAPPAAAPAKTADAPAKSQPAETVQTAHAAPVSAHAGPAAAHAERFLLYASPSPLLVELHLFIDGRPHTAALESLTQEVLKAADTDGDGSPTWQEIISSKRFRYGQYGNLPINDPKEADNMLRLYDVNKNGRVDASEVPRFLTRNAGGSQAFSLSSSNYFRGDNRSDSPLRRWLDTDDDELLDAAEIASAATRLVARDADDDGLLLPGELLAATATSMSDQRALRRRDEPDAASLLWSGMKVGTIQFSLEELYGGGGQLTREHFSTLPPAWFDRLDGNGNGQLEDVEFAGLADAPADLIIEARFGTELAGNDQPAAPASPSLRLVAIATANAESLLPRLTIARRLAFDHAGESLEFIVNDAVGDGDFDSQAAAQLTMFDADKNGYVDAAESTNLAGFVAAFEAVDADEDGKVFAAELAAYLRSQQAALRGQIRARVSHRDDALFAALDANHDGRLATREITMLAERLHAFDRDADGRIAIDEIPDAMTVAIVRGNPEQGDAIYAAPIDEPLAADSTVPTWFLRMDRNADGDLSRHEFLGTAEQFSQLDRDQDGFINGREAQKP